MQKILKIQLLANEFQGFANKFLQFAQRAQRIPILIASVLACNLID